MKKALTLLVFAGVLGCDGLNTSFDKGGSGGGSNPPISQKPTVCEFDFSKTCWAESAEQITSCLGDGVAPEAFSHSKEFCTNNEGKLVAFANPAAQFSSPLDINNVQIDFRVFPDSVNECLRVKGTPQKFKVTLAQSQKSMEFDFTGGQMKFKCLDGQTVQIPQEVFEGCSQSMGDKFVTTVPGMQMMLTQKGAKKQWGMRLRGAAEAPNFYNCSEP